MRFDVNLRVGVREQLDSLAESMRSWDPGPRLTQPTIDQIRAAIGTFSHRPHVSELTVGGAHAAGDYPSLAYGESLIHVTAAQTVLYTSDAVSGLREQVSASPQVAFTWIPGDQARAAAGITTDPVDADRIAASIIVDKESHKGIVVGAKGSRLREIGTLARLDMEKLFDGKVHLELWVRVKGGWSDDERALKQLGYD